MKHVISIFLFFLLVAPGMNYAQTKLKAGDKAPDFISKDQDGKTVSVISKERNLTESTIYTHCFRLIVNQLLSNSDILSSETVQKVNDAVNKLTEPTVKAVKELLPEISYDEIRCVLAEKGGKK